MNAYSMSSKDKYFYRNRQLIIIQQKILRLKHAVTYMTK
jgi:hypothetical protein